MRPERYRLTDTHTYFISATSTFGMLTTSKSALPYACWARDKADPEKIVPTRETVSGGVSPQSSCLVIRERERKRENK